MFKVTAALNTAAEKSKLKSVQELSNRSGAFTPLCSLCVWMLNLGMFWKFTHDPVKRFLSPSLCSSRRERELGDGAVCVFSGVRAG